MTCEQPKRLSFPIADKQQLRQLCAFDQVLLDGDLLVGRDQVHRLLDLAIAKGWPLPVELRNACMYYMGPSPAPMGRPIGSCGPTTSARMDVFTPQLLHMGLAAMVGKGPRSQAVVDAIVATGAVYLQAYGGCGALYASTVCSCEVVAFAELGPEALLRIQVKDFPVTVAIDSRGNSVY